MRNNWKIRGVTEWWTISKSKIPSKITVVYCTSCFWRGMRQSATERMFRVGTIYTQTKQSKAKKQKKKNPACKSSLTTSPTLGWVSQVTTNTKNLSSYYYNAIIIYFKLLLWQKQHSFIRLLCLSCHWTAGFSSPSHHPLLLIWALPEQPTTSTTTTTALLLTLLYCSSAELAQSETTESVCVWKEKEREREREWTENNLSCPWCCARWSMQNPLVPSSPFVFWSNRI